VNKRSFKEVFIFNLLGNKAVRNSFAQLRYIVVSEAQKIDTLGTVPGVNKGSWWSSPSLSISLLDSGGADWPPNL